MDYQAQQPIYPQVPEDEPVSSPSSPSQDWPPAIATPYPKINHRMNDLETSYTRRQGLRSRRSKSLLSPPINLGRDSATSSTTNKKTTRIRHDDSTSRSRHASSSASTQALLIVTNEELKRRITIMENEQSKAVTMFAEVVNERNNLQMQLNAANTKIRTYEIQYEAARREIRNAKQIIQRLEGQWTDAESNAARQRKRVRTLITEKLVKKGWDEGYREGVEEGYNYGQRKRRSSQPGHEDAQGSAGLFDRMRRLNGLSSERANRKSEKGRSLDDSDENDDRPNSSAARMTPSRRGSTASRPRQDSHPSSTPPLPTRPPSIPSSSHHPPSSGHSKTPIPRASYNSEPFPTSYGSPEVIHPIMPIQSDSVNTHSSPMDHNIPSPGPVSGHHTFQDNSSNMRHSEVGPPNPSVEGTRNERANDEPRGRQIDIGNGRKPRSRMTSRASTRISEFDLVSLPRHSGSSQQREDVQYSYNQASRDITYGNSRELVEEWRNIVSPASQVPIQDNHRIATPAQSPLQNSPPNRSKTPSQGQHTITPFLSFTSRMSSIPRTPSNRSPRVSGGPRQPRETVRSVVREPTRLPSTPQAVEPIFTSGNLTSEFGTGGRMSTGPPQASPRLGSSDRRPGREQPIASTSRQPAPSSQPGPEPPAKTGRAKTPIAWLRKQFHRSYSCPGVPHDINIQIEPPSHSPSDSNPTTAVVDSVLLSPEYTRQPIPPPSDIIAQTTKGVSILSSTPITITLPDEQLPPGFVPMTPLIPTGDVHESRTLPRSPTPRLDAPRSPEPEIFSPVPNNPVLSDPFTMSPIPRPNTAPGTRSPNEMRNPRNRTLSFAFGRWGGWTSPDSARLSRPISIFSESDV